MECRDGEDFEVELRVNEVIWRFLRRIKRPIASCELAIG